MNRTTIHQLACERAEIAAAEDAAEAILIARQSSEPVAFITGNSHMPPLRAFGSAERFWHADEDLVELHMDEPSIFQCYSDRFETCLDLAAVYLDCPEHDNALYVVDLQRFQPVDPEHSPESESMQDDWRPVS